MSLKEITDDGRTFFVKDLGRYRIDFERVWAQIPAPQQDAIKAEINRRLDELIISPDPTWGSITNTSLEGGKANPSTGVRGDWSGTPFHAIYEACGHDEEASAKCYGSVWKQTIIDRKTECWVGIRFDPSFPQRGVTLLGKTYFLDSGQ